MGYNKEDYIRIKGEYTTKYLKARERADARRETLYASIPEVRELDRLLSRTGFEIMAAITASDADAVKERIDALKQRNEALLAQRAELLRQQGYEPDYSDVKYDCELCGDTGYVDTKMCSCMKRALILAGYESSGLGNLIGKQTFENFSLHYYPAASREETKFAVEQLKSFANRFDGRSGISYLLFGGTGLGKTHLSTAVAQTVIDRGFDVLYVTAVGMLRDFEAKRFGNGLGERNTDRYYDSELLIIDDFGTEMINQFTASCMYEVINARLNHRRSTLINTNLTRKEIESKYGERIASRLYGEYFPLRFQGIDIRFQKLNQN